VARHEEELPYEGVARAVREHRGCAHAVEYVLVHEHLVRVRGWGLGIGVGGLGVWGFGGGLGVGG
jgi:hypothetical protein